MTAFISGTMARVITSTRLIILPITATVQTAFNYFESRGHLKRWTMVRPILTTDGSVTPGVGLNIDFGTGAPISIPSTVQQATGALWDVALWDVAIWPLNSSLVANWTTVEGIGQCCSIITKVDNRQTGRPTASPFSSTAGI
jgi:hypothetical protein